MINIYLWFVIGSKNFNFFLTAPVAPVAADGWEIAAPPPPSAAAVPPSNDAGWE